jgi:hypothetical protein
MINRQLTHFLSPVTLFWALTCNVNTIPVFAVDWATPRIVGGRDADAGEYSFFTSWASSCGATVIHDDILLTAAHVRSKDLIFLPWAWLSSTRKIQIISLASSTHITSHTCFDFFHFSFLNMCFYTLSVQPRYGQSCHSRCLYARCIQRIRTSPIRITSH